MTTRFGVHVLWTGLLLVAAGQASAQLPFLDPNKPKSHPSHVPVGNTAGDPRVAEALLQSRLSESADKMDPAALERLMQNPAIKKLAEDILKDPEKYGLKDRIRELQNQKHFDPSDPKWRDLLGNGLDPKNLPKLPADFENMSPKQLGQWQELLKKNVEPKPPPDLVPMPPTPPDVPNPNPPPTPTTPPPQPTPSPPPSTPQPAPPTEQERAKRDRFTKWLEKVTDRINQSNNLGSSIDGNRLGEEVGRIMSILKSQDQSTGLTDKAGEWTAQLPSLSEYLPKDGWPRPDLSNLESLLPENLPDIKFGSGPPSLGSPSLPSVGGGSDAATTGAALLQGIVLVLAVVGVGLLALLLWRGYRSRAAKSDKAEWKLGPWPVDPARLRSREEVVKAFEYLSLLRLGVVARTRHHRRLADDLAKPEPADRRVAVARMANLYEQARYSPPSDDLSAADLAAARRDVCDLAGVPSA